MLLLSFAFCTSLFTYHFTFAVSSFNPPPPHEVQAAALRSDDVFLFVRLFVRSFNCSSVCLSEKK